MVIVRNIALYLRQIIEFMGSTVIFEGLTILQFFIASWIITVLMFYVKSRIGVSGSDGLSTTYVKKRSSRDE